MNGFNLKLSLYVVNETWRSVTVPGDFSFQKLHDVIQVLFGFSNYHMYDFKFMKLLEDGNSLAFDEDKEEISYEVSNQFILNDVLDDSSYLIYTYDYGDNWEVIIQVEGKVDYDDKDPILTDYCGKYGASDDMGGAMVFDEIMDALDDEEELELVLDDYGMDMEYLDNLDFEKKFKKGSKILL